MLPHCQHAHYIVLPVYNLSVVQWKERQVFYHCFSVSTTYCALGRYDDVHNGNAMFLRNSKREDELNLCPPGKSPTMLRWVGL